MPRSFARREILRAAGTLGLPFVRNWCRAQTAGARWSEAAVRKLKREQEAAYGNLAQQLGLGNDPMKGYRYLARGPIPPEVLSRERFQQKFEPIFGKADEAKLEETFSTFRSKYVNAQPPTPYEDPNLYATLLEMSDSIETFLQSKHESLKSQYAATPHVVVGSLPTGQVNAITEQVAGTSEQLVLFHYGLFMYAHEMAKIAARCYPPLRPISGAVTFAAEPNPAAYARTHWEVSFWFKAVLRGYVVEGNPRSTPYFQLPDSYVAAGGLLLRSMELFMLGHEYAHILLRHMEKRHELQDEYDADRIGRQIMTNVMSGNSLRYTYWGADYMLSCYDILERCLSVLRNGSVVELSGSSTHPPTTKRREQLRAALREVSPGPETEEAIRLAVQLQTFAETVWQNILPDWMQMHEVGIRPSAIWG